MSSYLVNLLLEQQAAIDNAILNQSTNLVVGENGSLAYASPLNDVLALYTQMGSMRFNSRGQIHHYVRKAFKQDPFLTLSCVLKCLDIRGGMGERRTSIAALNELERLMDMRPYLEDIVLLSRWDILFHFKDKKVLDEAIKLIFKVLTSTHENEALLATTSLLCKWLPRKPKTVQERYVMGMLRSRLGVAPKALRQHLKEYSSTVEQLMSSKRWNEIEYSHVPSVAMNRLRAAFIRNDSERFEEYINSVNLGKSKINAGVLYPHDIFNFTRFPNTTARDELSSDENDIKLANSQWEALPDFFNNVKLNILPMLDLSGSMFIALPGSHKYVVDAAIGLSLYCSERIQGPFKHAILSFAEVPRFTVLAKEGEVVTPYERYVKLRQGDVGYSTNFESAYKLILETAKQNNVTKEQMPELLLVVSDMQFDSVNWNFKWTNYELLKESFENAGYKLPKLVFWNMRATGTFTVTASHEGVCEISGYSPSIMKDVLASIQNMSPMNTMMEGLKPYFKYMKTFDKNHKYQRLVSREEVRKRNAVEE